MTTRFNIQKPQGNDVHVLRSSFERLRQSSQRLDNVNDYYAALESIDNPTSNEKLLLSLAGDLLKADSDKTKSITMAQEGLLDNIRDAAKQAKDFTTTLMFNIRSSKGRVTKLKVMQQEVTKASGHQEVQMLLKTLGVLRTSSGVVNNTNELKTRMKKFLANVNVCLDVFDSLEKQVEKDFKKVAIALKENPKTVDTHLKEALVDSFISTLPSKLMANVSDVGNTAKEGYRISQYYSTLSGHTLVVRYGKKYLNLSKQKTISTQLFCEYLESLRIDYEMMDALDKQQTMDVNLSDIIDLLDMSETLVDKIEEYNSSRKPFYTLYESLQFSGLFSEDDQATSDAINIVKNVNQLFHSDIPAIVDSYSKIVHAMLTTCYSMLLSSEWSEQKNI